jgi:hypothetical protein
MWILCHSIIQFERYLSTTQKGLLFHRQCSEKFSSNSKLHEHIRDHHVKRPISTNSAAPSPAPSSAPSLASSSLASSSLASSSLASSLPSSISWHTKSNFHLKQLDTPKPYLIIHDLFRKFDSLRFVAPIPLYTKTPSSTKTWSWTKELELRLRAWTNNRRRLNVASILYANQSQLARFPHASTRTSPSFSFGGHLLRYLP